MKYMQKQLVTLACFLPQRMAAGAAGPKNESPKAPFKSGSSTCYTYPMSTGNQGVALILLAERRGDAKMAKLAVQQIEAAFTTMRDGGNAPSAAYYEAQLPKARALAGKLAKR
jgi:hypothetical protein